MYSVLGPESVVVKRMCGLRRKGREEKGEGGKRGDMKDRLGRLRYPCVVHLEKGAADCGNSTSSSRRLRVSSQELILTRAGRGKNTAANENKKNPVVRVNTPC